MLENKVLDAPWIDLTGGQDYLPLKKPIRVEKTESGFYVKDFELSLPKNYNLKQIKRKIKERYIELLFRENFKSTKEDDKLWEKIVNSDIVDYDAVWENLNQNVEFIELIERKDAKRLIKRLYPKNYNAIPKKYQDYFQGLQTGSYQVLIKYSQNKRIKSIDEISPANIEKLKPLLKLLKGSTPFMIARKKR